MYIGSLPAASNRATYTQDFQIYDDEDNEGVTLAGATITLEVRRPKCTSAEFSATIANGLINVTDEAEGRFELTVPVATMRNLGPMQYECGITILDASGETIQFFAGTLPVIDGIVS